MDHNPTASPEEMDRAANPEKSSGKVPGILSARVYDLHKHIPKVYLDQNALSRSHSCLSISGNATSKDGGTINVDEARNYRDCQWPGASF